MENDEIKTEVAWCMTFDQAEECRGASGRKLLHVCVFCPRYQEYEKRRKERKNEKNR